MKRKILLFFIFLLCSPYIAQAGGTYLSSRKVDSAGSSANEARSLWAQFLSCEDPLKKEKEILKCLKDTVTERTFKNFLSKVYEFHSLGLEVTTVYSCSKPEKEKLVEPEKLNVLCFKLIGNKAELTGYVYFKRENSQLKIDKIEY